MQLVALTAAVAALGLSAVSAADPCGDGFTYDAATGVCLFAVEPLMCSQGFVWDLSASRCVPELEPVECGDGRVLVPVADDSAALLDAYADTVFDIGSETFACVPELAPVECEPGYAFFRDNGVVTCVPELLPVACARGFFLNASTGVCQARPVPPSPSPSPTASSSPTPSRSPVEAAATPSPSEGAARVSASASASASFVPSRSAAPAAPVITTSLLFRSPQGAPLTAAAFTAEVRQALASAAQEALGLRDGSVTVSGVEPVTAADLASVGATRRRAEHATSEGGAGASDGSTAAHGRQAPSSALLSASSPALRLGRRRALQGSPVVVGYRVIFAILAAAAASSPVISSAAGNGTAVALSVSNLAGVAQAVAAAVSSAVPSLLASIASQPALLATLGYGSPSELLAAATVDPTRPTTAVTPPSTLSGDGDDSGLSAGAIAGIVIGALVVVGAAGLMYVRQQRLPKAGVAANEPPSTKGTPSSPASSDAGGFAHSNPMVVNPGPPRPGATM